MHNSGLAFNMILQKIRYTPKTTIYCLKERASSKCRVNDNYAQKQSRLNFKFLHFTNESNAAFGQHEQNINIF